MFVVGKLFLHAAGWMAQSIHIRTGWMTLAPFSYASFIGTGDFLVECGPIICIDGYLILFLNPFTFHFFLSVEKLFKPRFHISLLVNVFFHRLIRMWKALSEYNPFIEADHLQRDS